MISVTTIFWFFKMNDPKKINKNANDSVNQANIVICMLTICRRFLLDLIDFDKVFRNLAMVSVWILKNNPCVKTLMILLFNCAYIETMQSCIAWKISGLSELKMRAIYFLQNGILLRLKKTRISGKKNVRHTVHIKISNWDVYIWLNWRQIIPSLQTAAGEGSTIQGIKTSWDWRRLLHPQLPRPRRRKGVVQQMLHFVLLFLSETHTIMSLDDCST